MVISESPMPSPMNSTTFFALLLPMAAMRCAARWRRSPRRRSSKPCDCPLFFLLPCSVICAVRPALLRPHPFGRVRRRHAFQLRGTVPHLHCLDLSIPASTVGITSQRSDTAGRTMNILRRIGPRHHRRMNRQAIHDPHLAVHVLENPPRIPRGGVRRRMWADRTNRCRPDSTWTSTSTGAGTATRCSPRSRSPCSDSPPATQLTDHIAIVVNMSYGKDRTARTLVCQIAGTSTQSGPRTAMQTTSSTRFASKESS